MKVKSNKQVIAVIILCLIINVVGNAIVSALNLPIYLDSVGTIIAGAVCGYIPGIIVGLATNIIKCVGDISSIFYSSINVLFAVLAAYLSQRGYFKNIFKTILSAFLFAIIGGGLSSVLSWFLYGFDITSISVPFVLNLYNKGILNGFFASLSVNLIYDFADKLISVLIAFLFIHFVCGKNYLDMWVSGWRQGALTKQEIAYVKSYNKSKVSLQTKILLFSSLSMIIIAITQIVIGSSLFNQMFIREHEQMAYHVTEFAKRSIDPDMVDSFIQEGYDNKSYSKIEEQLSKIKQTVEEIEYLYVYKIEEDGCHVVFDIDTEDLEGGTPGDIIPFDESFSPYIKSLLAGEEIDPIITNDTYGYLLTVYNPLYDKEGNCVCYVAADIKMGNLNTVIYRYLAKTISIFLGFFILVFVIVLWFSKYNIILPILSMSSATSSFVLNDNQKKEDGVKRMKELDIKTGDEIETLYNSILKTSSDSVAYVTEIQNQKEKMIKMQDGLITVLAEVVESRDAYTGMHVKKTADYVKLIIDKLQEAGVYSDEISEEFAASVTSSAPLHDVGKIKIPDAILNKPGKLTDEEFEIMKTHTTQGSEIIETAIEIVPDPMFLEETKNLAEYHHEKWDGTGYPKGLKGEEIPLSARIMAVADVFDALVSERSYKKGFPYEKAFAIIEEGSGHHFDPNIVDVFLNNKEEVIKIAETKY